MLKVAVQVAVLGHAVAVSGGTVAVQVALARHKWLHTGMYWLWRVAVQVAVQVAANNGCASGLGQWLCNTLPKHRPNTNLIQM